MKEQDKRRTCKTRSREKGYYQLPVCFTSDWLSNIQKIGIDGEKGKNCMQTYKKYHLGPRNYFYGHALLLGFFLKYLIVWKKNPKIQKTLDTL
ncbi:MAG: hypothetical protein WC136_08550 [Sphaerochaeta sp.]|nr:hypothetical protein [Sphaerochaeta sp.]